MPFSSVYEDPWTRKPIGLGHAAVQHLDLIEIFLKLLIHLGDANGYITDETLAYVEWRYTVYLRFIDARGYCPNDHPPPWDVALVMYLHMLSPSRFHHYLYDNRNRVLKGIFGLEHRHFPMTKLLSGEWCPRRTQRFWNDWNTPGGSACGGPNLPYQLWPSAPWESKRHSRVLTRLLGKDATQPPSSDQKWMPPTDLKTQGTQGMTKHKQGPIVLMQQWYRCRTSVPEEGFRAWDIESYAAVRAQRIHERCRSQSQHEQFNEICGLQPWPSIQDLRAELDHQTSFWKVMTHAKNTVPGFVESLTDQVTDYEDFLTLFSGVLPKNGRYGFYKSKLDPQTPPVHPKTPVQTGKRVGLKISRLLPPTLEIDLLWHTHRLFPACYWVWSDNKADWVLEMQTTSGAGAGNILLGYTKEQWRTATGAELIKGTPVDHWFTEYVPAAAKHASQGVMRTDLA
ncbi:hypothetical protein FZEAL_8134, partial [Fusarium zealandicum]